MQRPTSILDRIYTKVIRIRKLESLGGIGLVEDSLRSEYLGVLNYCIMLLDKLSDDAGSMHPGFEVPPRWATEEAAKATYDRLLSAAADILLAKNHDYDEAWRHMRSETLTDELLVRLQRIHFLRAGGTVTDDGPYDLVVQQLIDMVNYSVLAFIRAGDRYA